MTEPEWEARREPAWLTAKADQRVKMLEFMAALGGFEGYEVVMITLTDPDADTDEATERHERTCDNCGAHCPGAEEFHIGAVERHVAGKRVVISFGVCGRCAA